MTIYYLMVKTHNVTGLKYLCQTKKVDPYKYLGSGKYWKQHLKAHGNDIHTEVLKECATKTELKDWGIYYSNLWNVTENKDWANLKDETGDGGLPKGFGLGRKLSDAHKAALRKAKKMMTEETIQKMVLSGKKSYEKTFALLTKEQRQEKYKNSLGKITTEQRREIGRKRENKGGEVWSKASAGQVTVTDKNGISKRIPQQLFNQMKTDMILKNIPMNEWEYVQVSSLESKRRKSNEKI